MEALHQWNWSLPAFVVLHNIVRGVTTVAVEPMIPSMSRLLHDQASITIATVRQVWDDAIILTMSSAYISAASQPVRGWSKSAQAFKDRISKDLQQGCFL